MGTTLQMIVLGPSTTQPELSSAVSRRLSVPDWWAAEFSSIVALEALEGLGGEISAALQKALAISIEDSDYAYLAGFERGRIVWALVLNEASAADYEEGVTALERCQRIARTEPWQPVAAEAFARWSETGLPQRSGRSDVLALLKRRGTEMAEDLVDEVLDLVGLTLDDDRPRESFSFGGAVFVADSGMTVLGDTKLDLATTRYVWGWGEEFYGIWDRERPVAPIARFKKSEGDRQKSIEQWSSLVVTKS